MFAYLIDQQMSAELSVTIDPSKYQCIEVYENIPIIAHREKIIHLSIGQAKALVQHLQDAVDKAPDHGSDGDFPGKVIYNDFIGGKQYAHHHNCLAE